MTSWPADFLVGDWRVSPKLHKIIGNGQTVSVKHKSMEVLVCLADSGGEVLSRNEIMDRVWPGMAVTDDVLTQSVVELRKAFGDDAADPKVIETIPRVGFRLIASVAPVESDSPPGDEPATARRSVLAAMALIFAGAVLWFVLDRQDSARQPIIPVYESQYIAVLPFVSMSDDPDNEYFADGMTEDIRTLLGKIKDLKVIGRLSSNQFSDMSVDYGVIGDALGVQSVVQGSVRISGNQVRIAAQLIDVSDGTQLWGDSYNRSIIDVSHIFQVQDDVTAAIINALQIHVSENPTRGRPTANADAYALFLRARSLLNDQKGMEAMALLRQAVELDPQFGEAYELLAFSYWQQSGAGIPIEEGRQRIMEAASNAFGINPDLAFARALYRDAAEPSEAGQTFIDAYEHAWRTQPGNTIALRNLIYSLGWAGYHEDAHRFAEGFVDLDPLSSIAQYSLGETLFSTGRNNEAMAPLEFAFELDNQFAQWFLPAVHLMANDDDNAIALVEEALARDGISDTGWVRELVIGARDPVDGPSHLKERVPEIIASMPDEHAGKWRFILRPWFLYFGYLDDYYDMIFEEGPPKVWTDPDLYVWIGTVMRHNGFTAHPRYLEAAQSLGVIGIWERHGPPNFCKQLDGDWVCD